MGKKISWDEVIELHNHIKDNDRTLAQALLNMNTAFHRQSSEDPGSDTIKFGADYGAIDRRVVTKAILSEPDEYKKMVLRKLIMAHGPHRMSLYFWERKYVNDKYTKVN